MHVLGITDHLGNVGGAEISARTILVGLAAHEAVDRVTVVGVDDPSVARLDFDGVKVVPVEPPPGAESLPDFAVDLFVERRLAKAAREHVATADVVHAHHRRSALALSHLDTGVPTVATIRDFWPACPISIYHVGGEQCTGCEDRLDDCVTHQGWDGLTEPGVKAYLLAKRRHQRPALDAADCAVFIADHLQDRLDEMVPLPDWTETIYNPVEIDANVESAQFNVPTFVTASSLSESKGIETAVRAMAAVTETHPEAQLIVFGDGPRREELESLAAEVAPGAIVFRGRVDPAEVYAAMAGATATVFPSVWDEPFGRVTVESMMLGTPVVGSAVGGITEVIEEGKTGLLFPPGDEATLAERLRALARDDELRGRITEAARTASEEFQPERVTGAHVACYRSLAE